MSEWKEYKLGEILHLITKGTTPPNGVGFVDNGGINYVKSEAHLGNNLLINLLYLPNNLPEHVRTIYITTN